MRFLKCHNIYDIMYSLKYPKWFFCYINNNTCTLALVCNTLEKNRIRHDLLNPYFFVECKIGFLSAQGKSCSPCTSNMFGMKCSEICNCKKNERFVFINLNSCCDTCIYSWKIKCYWPKDHYIIILKPNFSY